ncbi:MAG TPA: hypothetical protein VEC37_15620, partial [Bacillota bacterium]|nr:hypothetical protein [Bacillota bacterium]
GIEATTVKTYLKYHASVVVPATAGINKFLLNQLEANLPSGFEMKEDVVKLVSAQVLPSQLETTNLNLIGSVVLRGVLSHTKLKELLKGKSIDEAKQILTGQNEVSEFKIETKDPKSRYLPRFSFQIKILFPAGPKKG